MRRVLWLILLGLLLAPADAGAGVAFVEEVTTDSKYGYTSPELFYRADPGERNQLLLIRMNDASADFVLRDFTASLRPGPGCRAYDLHTVICDGVTAYLDAGDGDDEVSIAAGTDAYVYVRGGAGNDKLVGAGALAGGPGRDVVSSGSVGRFPAVLAGGGGDDLLRGDRGDEVLSGDGSGPAWPTEFSTDDAPAGPAGNDSIDGGRGTDTVTYSERESSVRVDLAAGRVAGAGGERDTLRDIENAAGGDGPDLLLGDGRPNVLEGDSGDDRLDGRGGKDYLLGNLVPDLNEYSPTFTPADHGVDTLRGGAGDDRLDAGGELRDRMFGGAGDDLLEAMTNYGPTRARTVSCGTGSDVLGFDPHGQLLSDCERVDFANEHARIALRPERGGGAARLVASCERTNPFEEPCTFSIRLRMGSAVVAKGDVAIAQGSRRVIRMRTRRALRRGDVVEIALRVRAWKRLPARQVGWRVRLR